jgi:RNase P subunit RPR2
MNAKRFEISTHSRYSWQNLHQHNYVTCRKCTTPLLPAEFSPAIGALGKIVVASLPERCAECETRKRLKQEEKKEARLAAKEDSKRETPETLDEKETVTL